MTTTDPARIAVDLAGSRARVTHLAASPYVAPRLVDQDAERVRIALVAVCATLLAGDHVRIDVRIGAGVRLELIEPTGTVAYDARGAETSWHATATVGERATLVWAGAPFVVADGAHVHRRTTLDIDDGAMALVRELLVLGRSGESGGRLRAQTDVAYNLRPLLVEDIDLRDPDHRSAPGILGGSRVVGTIALLGTRPTTLTPPYETPLAGPGALARSLTSEVHLADDDLADAWKRWRELIDRPLAADAVGARGDARGNGPDGTAPDRVTRRNGT